MKRIAGILLAAAVLASCGTAFAQEETPVQPAAAQITEPAADPGDETASEVPAEWEVPVSEMADMGDETASEIPVGSEVISAETAADEMTADEETQNFEIVGDPYSAEDPAAEAADASEAAQGAAVTGEQSAAVIASGTCGEGLTWTLDAAGVLTISGTGAMDEYSCDEEGYTAPWSDCRDDIRSVVVERGVSSVCGNAFCDCGSLTSVTISDSVISIETEPFGSCGSLTDITFGGTMLRWADIHGSGNSLTVHCVDGDIMGETAGA